MALEHSWICNKEWTAIEELNDVRASPYNQPQQSPRPKGKSS
ncbi:hypothetical protein NC653_011340 [Populus alba x Populus x berolinensis]|uniref:Uncharacterized protein n=1 Tax=Populus alba x Populus x berolinensis TaxID=444605 RepID=A0AAD6R221_9ROSI|nr:hypothetical protein NC653_011340 [Populus alba x Populus x berolinensis]